ncbi:DUF4097 family beta strand repeat-containing protein [Mycolicibacterium litorale]|uniref:Adhesin domain-containing protein n=1 Tax=Mycolicibacterium litorale TaxID=758802 RepID=A0AAD1IJH8_9MYCO|nr:hypothetical protein [Mycolicibacterium litorale]MCV7414620.1 hypothetical protein [Mycolicibacterium litorale]TDY00885.1 hypothetical protein BCL50_5117 [Mycolicibacterium litorale]BBY14782.1 hypothetical protein MLIT_03740 [Mycolicibacterium litorale]
MTTITPPPPAPVGPPPELSPGGRTALRGILIAAAAVLVVGSVAALAVTAWGLSTVRVLSDSHALPAGMRSLVIDSADVPVAIRIATDPDAREARASLRLVNTASGGDHRLALTNTGPETRLVLEGRPARAFGWARGGEITVTLPPEQARRLDVRTQQQTGVVFAQADVDQLIARTTHGAVILSGSARRVEVQTDDGAVTARDPISVRERFAATTSEGDIVVDFRDAAPRTVEMVSRDGDIVLGLPDRGPYLVRAQSGDSTKVRVPETTDPADAVSEITARSDRGNIVIEEGDNGWR